MFSQTVEYALRAMVFLAKGDHHTTPAQVIAGQIHVPERYMSKVMRALVVAGLVESRRGPGGGFTLTRAPRDISMLAVVEAVDPLPPANSRANEAPLPRQLCAMHQRMLASSELLRRDLNACSIEDLTMENGCTRSNCRLCGSNGSNDPQNRDPCAT